jgi:hypothetical protein
MEEKRNARCECRAGGESRTVGEAASKRRESDQRCGRSDSNRKDVDGRDGKAGRERLGCVLAPKGSRPRWAVLRLDSGSTSNRDVHRFLIHGALSLSLS